MPLKASKGAKKKADDMFSKIVRARGQCIRCSAVDNLQTAHIISRRFSHTRCDLDNAFCACAGCHRMWTDNPVVFGQFVLSEMGAPAFALLNAKSQLRTKVDWEAEVERLRPLLAAVNA